MKLSIVFVCGLFFVQGLFAQEVAPPAASDEAAAIQQVIEDQWAAFAGGDGEKALSLAAPEIKDRFDSAQAFLDMVEGGYPVVFHHFTYRFMETRIGNHRSWQFIRMVDLNGEVWFVLYQLFRQDSGGWLIGGVYTLPGAPTPGVEPTSPRV
ncbi:MAG: DUF4864 domain-containing protein [Spirochaetales bacterium]